MDNNKQTIPSSNSKLGLALSGGGFRASLFHIGVLAKMAESNRLKDVQVISTVSGGSIIGALYYLKIKELLENKRKDGIKPSDKNIPDTKNKQIIYDNAYIKIVSEIERDFLEAVQKNIRMRTFLNPLKNAKMLSADYSRSDRIAELYTKHIYENVWDNITNNSRVRKNILVRFWNWANGNPTTGILLKDLKILPDHSLWNGNKFDFDLYQENAEHKIPVLVINATTLNTGNCWQFTAVSVREVSSFQYSNANNTLPKLYLSKPNKEYGLSVKEQTKRANMLNRLELGDAVAASAAVPGIFSPFSIHDLYKVKDKEFVVQLVDGGVYDNQGIDTLVHEWKCDDIICSDASGQLIDKEKPSTGELGVVTRTNDILMDRVRDFSIADFNNKGQGKRVFMHLRDSSADAIFNYIPTAEKENLKEFIANVRTDLDSFTDTEAYSLMYFGYKQSEIHLMQKFGTIPQKKYDWNFLKVENKLTIPKERKKVIRHLKISEKLAGKIFRLNFAVTFFSLLPVAWLVVYASIAIWRLGSEQLIPKLVSGIVSAMPEFTVFETVGYLGITVGYIFLDNILNHLGKLVQFSRLLRFGFGPAAIRVFLPFVFTTVASILVLAYLKIYNWLYIQEGKI